MIKIRDLTVKNFMSVGNATQAVDFDREQLTLVLGENLDQGGDDSGARNGTGKTTIVNALSYAIFGQALTNIKKDNLINKINSKNMLVTVEFEKNGREYRIERGRKPNVLKFYIDNQEQADGRQDADDGQGDSRETQKDIDELIGMSHDMFKHIVALNTYTEPFLSMKSGEQRVIIEQLLGITLLSEKAEALKEQTRLTKDEITQETLRIDAVKKANERIQESINSLKLKQTAWQRTRDNEIVKIERAIAELADLDVDTEIAQHDKLKVYDEQAALIKSLNKERATLETALMQADKSVKKYTKDVEQLADNKCPACEQDLHDHKHDDMIAAAGKSLTDSDAYMTKVAGDLSLILKELELIGDINGRPKTFYETLNEAYNHRSNLESLAIQLGNKQEDVDTYQEQIADLENTALQNVSWDTVNSLTSMKEHQEFLLKLLTNKDSFIRKKIIDQNLAYLNNRLTYYLDKVGLPHSVVFQNDLTVEITQLGQDLDFDNLSRGERNRLILGLSWSFRDVWESLYQSINLLFVDELIDSGMDANGVENSLSILKKMGRERHKNIYLISHRDELIGRVNNVLKVIKENGFTSYANDIDVYE
jgi:DNA repair exonuclease SbcCD ATPase subunit